MATNPTTMAGLGGIDFSGIINNLVQVSRQPINDLTAQQQTVQSKITDLAVLSSNLGTMQGTANTLRTQFGFDKNAASVSDTTILTASAASTAQAASYQVQVTQLATAHQITNKNAKAVATTGTSITAGGATFAFQVGTGAVQTVTLAAGATLHNLVDAINNLGAGVQATTIDGGTPGASAFRLVLTANNTGSTNALTITQDTTSLDFLNTSGTGGTDTLQGANNAIMILGNPAANPLTLTRTTNTITDAINGVTLNLQKTTSGTPIFVNVTKDTAGIKTNVKSLLTAYNTVVQFINDHRKLDATGKAQGTLAREPMVDSVLSQIRNALANDVTGLSVFTSVAQVGVNSDRNGILTLDEAQFDKVIASNYSDVRNVFIGQTATTGAAQRLYSVVDTVKNIQSGVLSIRQQSLTNQVADLAKKISDKSESATQYEQKIRLQFAQLDTLLQKMHAVTTQLNAMGIGASGTSSISPLG